MEKKKRKRARRKLPMRDLEIGRAISALTFMGALGLAYGSCTGQVPSSFRYIQQVQTFNTQLEVNTKIDLLWVVDNSSSMDVSQKKLRAGFRGFALKYMKPTWDIRLASITTDTYLANSAFSAYLATTMPQSTGYSSPYLTGASRLSTFSAPKWWTRTVVNPTTGVLDNGITYGEIMPLWGPSYARLLPGYHDGPITAFCFEGMPYFMKSVTQCKTRDDQTLYLDAGTCGTTTDDSSLWACVNTVENDRVRSGKAIVSTIPPTGVAADSAWTDQLVQNVLINLSTGSAGHNSERGISSLLQLLSDNESTDTRFFRKGSLRGIIFISDEDDQSMTIPSNPPAGYSPDTDYACDQSSLLTLNSGNTSLITGTNGYCCTTSGNNCKFGSQGTSCSPKTVDGSTYTLSICPISSKLLPLTDVKSQLDQFFTNLDGVGSSPNYFIASIVATSASAIQTLQSARDSSDTTVGTIHTVAVDRGDRYINLGNLVGADSLVLDISSNDYSPILDAIGKKIVEKKSTFTLNREPTAQEDMIVSIHHANGTDTPISYKDYKIQGKSIIFTNSDVVLGFSSTDKISINYQPKTPK